MALSAQGPAHCLTPTIVHQSAHRTTHATAGPNVYPPQELWQLLISANETGTGIPQRFLDEKAEEMRRQKEEAERVQVGSGGCGRPGCRGACVHAMTCIPAMSGCELAPALPKCECALLFTPVLGGGSPSCSGLRTLHRWLGSRAPIQRQQQPEQLKQRAVQPDQPSQPLHWGLGGNTSVEAATPARWSLGQSNRASQPASQLEQSHEPLRRPHPFPWPLAQPALALQSGSQATACPTMAAPWLLLPAGAPA